MDHEKFGILIKQLYSTVYELELMFPGRHFTPDGHMVGSIGECLVADAYNLKLMTASNEGYDAVDPSGKKVEIKATQSKGVSFRFAPSKKPPEYVIIIKIFKDGTFEVYYNGPGDIIWREFEGRKKTSNGQYQISLIKVKSLNDNVPETQRIVKN